MERAAILVFAGTPEQGEALAARVRDVGFRPIVVKAPVEAQAAVEDPRFAIRAALLPTDIPVVDLGAALRDLRARSAGRRLKVVLAGPQPPDELGALREAGVDLVLWEPAPEGALRFQLNRALDDGRHPQTRAQVRAPVARRVRIVSGHAAKAATLYSLSTGGAFIETPRPSPRRARVKLDLILRECDVPVEADVLYTNVPGNLQRQNLPVGMGVAFQQVAPDAVCSIERAVREAGRFISFEEPPQPDTAASGRWIHRLVRRRS